MKGILRRGLGALLALAALAQGCETVGLADKSGLARPCMQFDDSRHSQALVGHVLLTQEQADGGAGGEGGGCGCR